MDEFSDSVSLLPVVDLTNFPLAGRKARGFCGLRSSEPQTHSDDLRLEDDLPSSIPILLVAVISKLTDDNDLVPLLDTVRGMLCQRPEGNDPVEDRREVLVLAGVAIEASAIDSHVE